MTNEKRMRKRKINDFLLDSLTYISSMIGTFVLVAILAFVFIKGFSLISWEMLTGPYWAENYYLAPVEVENIPSNFDRPEGLPEEVVWSEEWGIGLVDYMNHEKEHLVLVEYIAEDSIFQDLTINNTGDNFGDTFVLETGIEIHKIEYLNPKGVKRSAGSLVGKDATQTVEQLSSATNIVQLYVKTTGGGISGSIKATIYLILIALLIALPIGISSAIYLYEYAPKNRMTNLIRSSIEMLSGVPSIIFGLMGVTVLFPITQLFGANGTSILLGGFTLAIIVLPTMIRSTEEALIVVPDTMRHASLSLGANKTQTIFKVVLPSAIPGILTAVLLSLGRIIGESAALIYTMGTFINDKPHLLDGGTSLAVHIWSVMSGEQPNFELASAISIVILAIVLILNIGTKLISKKLSRAWY